MEAFRISIARSPAMHRQIERALRSRIESGELAVGTALPSTPELARQMGVHALTVQKALRRLKNDGLIDRTPRLGSFVRGPAQAPAIALLFGPCLSDEHTHFYRALLHALQAELSDCWTIRVYDGLFQDSPQAGAPNTRNAFPALRKDCASIPFHGLIVSGLAKRPWEQLDSLRRLPLAWLGQQEAGADMTFDFGHFTQSAVAHFAERKCRHVAYLRTFGSPTAQPPDLEAFRQAAASFDIPRTEVHQLDALYSSTYDEHTTYARVSAIVQGWNRTLWPDAILVSDDVVMRAVALALLNESRAGARQVDLLTWANEKVVLHYGLPVTRYQVSVADCAARLKAILSRRMDGLPPAGEPERIWGRIVENDERKERVTQPTEKER